MPEGDAAPGTPVTGDAAHRWGDLPLKEMREALDSGHRELPARWRNALRDYYRRLSELEEPGSAPSGR